MPARDTIDLLLGIPEEEPPQGIALGEDVRFWMAAARFALSLLARQRLLPALVREGDAYLGRWQAWLDETDDAGAYQALCRAMPPCCRTLAWEQAAAHALRPEQVLSSALDAVIDALAREARPFARPEAAIPPARRGRGPGGRQHAPARRPRPEAPLSPGEAWLEALSGDDPTVHGDPAALAVLFEAYRAWTVPASPETSDTFRVSFRLDPPSPGDDEEESTPPDAGGPADGSARWALRYFLQASDDPSLLVPAARVWKERGEAARFLDRHFERPQERLLAGLGRGARLFPPIEASLQDPRPEGVALSTTEAHAFVRESAALLRASGFGVLIPSLQSQLRVRLQLGRKGASSTQEGGPGAFGLGTLLDYDWEVSLGGEALSREEFEALARLKEPLVQIRGQWVELQPEQVEQALRLFGGDDGGQMRLDDALRLALAPEASSSRLPVEAVAASGWMEELLESLKGDGQRSSIGEPPGFQGTLRGYQRAGVAWLATLGRFGLGACLADDMGLGKTVQLIALILHAKVAPVLLICPTSVVGNWRREIERFAPSLRVLVHHGAERTRQGFAVEAAGHDIVISSYALLHRDEAELAGVEWDAVVLDEAQNIKNAETRSARAARRLPARWRAALTGTPVENRLSELWSIFQFLNPGYLGSQEGFRRAFARPIERLHDASAMARLKALAGPFLLRRVKTDRSIIADLPEKQELKVFCTLTQEQATLYQAVLRDALREIDESKGMQRRGLVLAMITRLKQICDHPALFLHDGSALSGRSGKLARLEEMLEEVVEEGDRALIFTQYAEMGRMLKGHLEGTLSREALFLHGGTPAKQRDAMVERFQEDRRGPQLFILSLKAGGTGLNLTRANHVFHFDRWWNPAVENQATDRAFRIGQRRDVLVHKFIGLGTFEEALDQLIERKLELAEAITGAGETWITELSTEQLRELFTLRREALTVGA